MIADRRDKDDDPALRTIELHRRALEMTWGVKRVADGAARDAIIASRRSASAPPVRGPSADARSEPRTERASRTERAPRTEGAPRERVRVERPPVRRPEPNSERGPDRRAERPPATVPRRSSGIDVGAPFGERPPVTRLDEDAKVVSECTQCGLCETRTNTVYGVGDPDADLMFIGEGPGADEDQRGEPFVGRAGELLDKIIGALERRRSDVYIANVVKCRPPGNRNPAPDEVSACRGFLERQIETVRPKLIVCLGRQAAQVLLETDGSIRALRGGRHSYRGIRVVVTYHPAYLLRDPSKKKHTWQDLQAVFEVCGRGGTDSGGTLSGGTAAERADSNGEKGADRDGRPPGDAPAS